MLRNYHMEFQNLLEHMCFPSPRAIRAHAHTEKAPHPCRVDGRSAPPRYGTGREPAPYWYPGLHCLPITESTQFQNTRKFRQSWNGIRNAK